MSAVAPQWLVSPPAILDGTVPMDIPALPPPGESMPQRLAHLWVKETVEQSHKEALKNGFSKINAYGKTVT